MALMRENSPETARQYVEAESWVELVAPDGSKRHAVLLHIGSDCDPTRLVWALSTAVEKDGRETAYILIHALLDPEGVPITGPEGQSRARWALHDQERSDLQEQDRRAEAADGRPSRPVPVALAVPVPLTAALRLILPPEPPCAAGADCPRKGQADG